VADGSPYAAYKVEDKKAFRSPHIFQHIAKHPQGKHIREQMPKSKVEIVVAAVHEDMRNQLPPMKVMRLPVVQPEDGGQVKP